MENKRNNDSAAIQNEFKQLFKELMRGEGGQACLFNLIVYTQDPIRTAYFRELANLVNKQFPCRIIFIQWNPAKKENDFHVQVHRDNHPNESGFTCDEILIEVAGEEINRIYFLLFPLLVPDLPIYLLWGQDPTTEHTILPHLEHFATRLIFDSEITEDLQQFSRGMLNRLSSSPIQIVDMNWARIGNWREALAQIYDSPERFAQLATASSIQLFYNNRPSEFFTHPQTQAIYFQAWLASRLKWQFLRTEKEEDSQVIYYETTQQTCRIQLTPILHAQFESEEIVEMIVKGEEDYECHIKRMGPDQVRVQASNQYQCELPFLFLMPNLRSGRSLMQEIFYQKTSEQYQEVLDLIRLVKWS